MASSWCRRNSSFWQAIAMAVDDGIDEGVENPLATEMVGGPEMAQQNNGYEEFFGGTRPCPTCRGVGRIPRGLYFVYPMPLDSSRS